MDEVRYDVDTVAEATMRQLKDFQRATVNRIIELFRKDCNRVLVADEVGLGKTVVARGVIAEFARLRKAEGDDLVKVAYICSNQNIASQNIHKLAVSKSVYTDIDAAETRLSMQHLRIAEQTNDPKIRAGYVQIIPLTPETSFRMTSGSGTRAERALMCVMLERLCGDSVSTVRLRNRLYGMSYCGRCASEDDSWKGLLAKYEKRVAECTALSGNAYPRDFLARLEARDARTLVAELLAKNEFSYNDPSIRRLRQIFAEESAAMLEPDLVIMDEFQRFRFLLDSDEESETGILARRFLKTREDKPEQKLRVLLLSATPYKLYSTGEEIAAAGQDEAYREFLELLDFLFEGRPHEARTVWGDYTRALEEHRGFDASVLVFKRRAEDMLSKAMCRTERISVMESGDYLTDEQSRKPLEVLEGDVSGYVEMARLLRALGLPIHLPVDYAKSCPYLMSYLRGYQIKEKIEGFFTGQNRRKVDLAKGRHLWLKQADIANFRPLPKMNARLESLKALAFEGNDKRNPAFYMWVPPTVPYYPLRGVYSGAAPFSKILVFSSWEMVPRMIATLLSYEAERRTVAYVQDGHYFKSHSPRLREREDGNYTAAYKALVEPDELDWLVELWNPIETLNAHLDFDGVKRTVLEKVRARFGRQADDVEDIWVDKALGSPAVCIARSLGLKAGDERIKQLASVFWKRFNGRIGTAVVERAYERQRDASSHWQDVLRYCRDGCFQAMFDEYVAVIREEVSFDQPDRQLDEIVRKMSDALELRESGYEVDTYPAFCSRVYKEVDAERKTLNVRVHYAVGFIKGKGEIAGGIRRKDAIRKSFNSPLRPFVLASTSIGQEGLDFHPYCRRIFHWNLPSNPVDLEQREGRINRYKCLAVRENAALKYGNGPFEHDVWKEIYAAAEKGERHEGVPELIPFWCFGKNQQVKIERIVPKYPCSRDEASYSRLIEILSLYRLSMGQPRQEELLEGLLDNANLEVKKLKDFFINLSPIMRCEKNAAPPCDDRPVALQMADTQED